ncbi:MAG: hypothetical protein HC933_03640 [Pleurocapsa sp. SU_196_0]|nr:hypothetical protein [Pleurocapsa sp. SU_196_0]
MNLRWLGAMFFGTCFMGVNAVALLLTGVWLRFSSFEAQMTDSNFSIPAGQAEAGLTIDVLLYRLLPFITFALLVTSSVCLFVTVRLSR